MGGDVCPPPRRSSLGSVELRGQRVETVQAPSAPGELPCVTAAWMVRGATVYPGPRLRVLHWEAPLLDPSKPSKGPRVLFAFALGRHEDLPPHSRVLLHTGGSSRLNLAPPTLPRDPGSPSSPSRPFWPSGGHVLPACGDGGQSCRARLGLKDNPVFCDCVPRRQELGHSLYLSRGGGWAVHLPLETRGPQTRPGARVLRTSP